MSQWQLSSEVIFLSLLCKGGFLHLRRGNLQIDRNTRKVVPRDADELANLCKLIFRRLGRILQPILRSGLSWIERISQSMKKIIFHVLVSAPPGLRWHRRCLLIAAVIDHQLQVEVTPHASQWSRKMNDARHKFSFTTFDRVAATFRLTLKWKTFESAVLDFTHHKNVAKTQNSDLEDSPTSSQLLVNHKF